MTQFSTWLITELETRGWSRADFAARAGIGGATLNALLEAGKTPAPDLCATIARALELQAEDVFRYAGLLPERQISESSGPAAGATPALETLTFMLLSVLLGLFTAGMTTLAWGAFVTVVMFLMLGFVRERSKRNR